MSLLRAFVKSLVKNVGKHAGNYASGFQETPAIPVIRLTWVTARSIIRDLRA